jgi:hypothetical protein
MAVWRRLWQHLANLDQRFLRGIRLHPGQGSGRAHGAEVVANATTSVTVDAVLVTYPRRLLTLARKLIDDGEFAIAVVVAHMACEVATERTLSEAFAAKGISFLEDSISEFFTGYSLNNDRLRKLYTALTGDQIEQAPFWAKFRKLAKQRNAVVHSSSAVVTETEANESHQTATDLVAHMKK